MWNKEDHPRDEEGKFTFKNGGNDNSTGSMLKGYIQISPAKILYRNQTELKEIEARKQKIKNELLDILGPKATHADILYGSEESLRKKIKELNLLPFSHDKEQHETLRQLSIYCYDNGRQSIPKGYERMGHFKGKNNGFDAVVVKNDAKKEIVIAFRGMEIFSKDFPSTARTSKFNYTSQQKDAQAVYEKIKKDPRYKDYEIQTTGQSLGGYLAQYVAAKNNLKSATFNAFHGAKETIQKEAVTDFQTKIIHPKNIINYRNKEDFWTNKAHDNDLGLSLETQAEINKKSSLLDQYHISENMGSLEKAEVKNQNYDKYLTPKNSLFDPIFLGKIRNFFHDKLN